MTVLTSSPRTVLWEGEGEWIEARGSLQRGSPCSKRINIFKNKIIKLRETIEFLIMLLKYWLTVHAVLPLHLHTWDLYKKMYNLKIPNSLPALTSTIVILYPVSFYILSFQLRFWFEMYFLPPHSIFKYIIFRGGEGGFMRHCIQIFFLSEFC